MYLRIFKMRNALPMSLLTVVISITRAELIPKAGLKASQSGTYSLNNSAGTAIDGLNTTCSIACTGCLGGDKTNYAWLQLDLLRPYEVQAVALIAYTDSTNAQYLENFVILVRQNDSTSDPQSTSGDLCNHYQNQLVTPNQFVQVSCTKPLQGRYLTFKRQGGTRTDALSTCEVFIWGRSLDGLKNQTTNILDVDVPIVEKYTRGEIIGISLGAIFGFLILLLIGFLILFCIFTFKQRSLPEDKVKVCPSSSQSSTQTLATSSSDQSPVRSEEFYNHVKSLRDMELLRQFKSLPEDELYEVTEARKSVNLCKNCFQNILPYDKNRVKINGLISDYVNASYVKGFSGQHKYIATQDPMDVTIVDFWTMIWQERVTRIVSLSNCSRFWPEVKESYGSVSVTMVTEENYSMYNKRLFVLETNEGCFEVIQLEYLDDDFLNTPFHFLSFVNKVRNSGGASPVVVHCSAGVGRTGCYVAVDFLLDELELRDQVGVVTCVERLRHQRVNSVQTLEQFSFIYDVILEKIQFGRATVTWHKLAEKVERVMKVKARGKLELDKRHQVLQEFIRNDLEKRGGENSVNRNDVHLHSYKKKNSYWLRKVPDVSQFESFWRSLYEAKVDVCLVAGVNIKSFWPIEVNVEHSYDVIGVTCKEMNFSASDVIKMSRYELVNYSEVNSPGHHLTIMHLEYSLPSAPNDLFGDNMAASHVVDLYSRISLKNCPSSSSVAFLCHDGVTDSGTLAASFYLLDALKIERIADVTGACRHVTSVQSQAISTTTQYKFIHRILLSFLKNGSSDQSSDNVKTDIGDDGDVKGVTFDPIGSSFI